MQREIATSVIGHFAMFADPPVDRRKLHLLTDMLVITTYVAFCGAAQLLFLADALARPTKLPMPNFRDAAVVTPDSMEMRPIIIGLHGNFDRPEWFCEVLVRMVEGRAWILCPRGIPRTDVPRSYDRWTFPHRQKVMAEIEAGLAALRARFPGRQAPGPMVLAGFSLGAILASRFAVANPKRFPYLYLAEGGHKVWTPTNIWRFASSGGQSLVLGCGGRGCGARSNSLCRACKKAGVHCSSVTALGLGHSYTDPLLGLALPLFRQMMTSDPRW